MGTAEELTRELLGELEVENNELESFPSGDVNTARVGGGDYLSLYECGLKNGIQYHSSDDYSDIITPTEVENEPIYDHTCDRFNTSTEVKNEPIYNHTCDTFNTSTEKE